MRQCLILTECKHFNCSSFNNKKKNELTDAVYELSPAITVWVRAVREKKRKSLKRTSRDGAIFVRQIFSPLPESPWETNDVFSFTPPPSSWTDKAGSGTGQAKLMRAWSDQRAGNKRGAEMKAVKVKSDMCHSVMSSIPTSRVTVAAATAWVRGWHQRHKLSDRLWKDLIPPCYCSPG